MSTKVWISVFLCLGPLVAGAAETNSPAAELAAIRLAADKFMATWCSADTNVEMTDFFEGHSYRPYEVASMRRKIASQLQARPRLDDPEIGKRVDNKFEFVGSLQIGNSVLKLAYVEKFELRLVAWSFWFYKADKEWRLNNFLQDEETLDEMCLVPPEGMAAAEPVKPIAEQVFTELATGKGPEGLTDLFAKHYFQVGEAANLAEQLIKSYRNSRALLDSEMGKRLPGGLEPLGTKCLGKSVVKLYFLERRDYGALPWVFSFYKMHNVWTLLGVAFGDAVPRFDVTSMAAAKGP